MRRLLILLLLLWGMPAWAGTLRLDPASVVPGGVSWLRYSGGAEQVSVRFAGQSLPLLPEAGGGRRLLGVDLGQKPGRYPVSVRAVFADGHSEQLQTALVVKPVTRPVERLQLPDAMVSPKDPAVLARIDREWRQLQKLFRQRSPLRRLATFRRPVTDPTGSPFGLRRVLNGQPRSPHSGVDFRSPRGTPVHAPAAGRVVFAGGLYYTGRTVILDHGGGLFSIFAHLEQMDVALWTDVAAGTVLGRVGSSGRATGPHLHWSVRLAGARVDPLQVVARYAGKSLD